MISKDLYSNAVDDVEMSMQPSMHGETHSNGSPTRPRMSDHYSTMLANNQLDQQYSLPGDRSCWC